MECGRRIGVQGDSDKALKSARDLFMRHGFTITKSQ
jgi:hypothetical protein